jgi:ketosteroid isomerase-like protein
MNDASGTPLLNDEHYEDRQALREILRKLSAAINEQDWATIRPMLDENVQITMIDQVTLHGQDALADYVQAKLGRYGSILVDFNVDPVPDAPAVFYGDTAVCTVSSADRFVFRNGKDFLVQDRYTATLVKQDGDWKLVALHGGTNAFNNPISFQAQRLLTAGAAIAAAGGVVLGVLLGRKG